MSRTRMTPEQLAEHLARFRGGPDAPLVSTLKQPRKPRVARTRNGGTWTEAAYWGRLRSALRKAFQWWKPAQDALKAAKVGGGYLCAGCKRVYPRKQVQIDHRHPCESLTQLDHLPQFVARLTCEGADNFQTLCVSCHASKSAVERVFRQKP